MQRYLPILILLCATTGALTSLLYLTQVPCLLVANFTDSMPRGLYLRRPPTPLRRDSIVLFRLPDAVWADFGPLMHAWGWSPESGPFLTYVGALPGHWVYLSGGHVRADGAYLGEQLRHATHGNPSGSA